MSIELTRHGHVAVLTFAHPPVNAFNLPTRRAIVDAFDELRKDSHIAAIVVTGAGSGFSAGGDRKEFGSPQAGERPTLSRDVLAAISTCGKPVIAAIHGFAVGGGLEFALACHARVAVAAARIGLPEVSLGRFPLSGSQRLPRLIGLERAVEWMIEAHMTTAADTEARNIFELIVDDQGSLMPAAIELAERSIRLLPELVERMAFTEQDPASAIARIEAKYPLPQRTKAQHALMLAVSAAVSAADFHAGLEQAQQIFDQLLATS